MVIANTIPPTFAEIRAALVAPQAVTSSIAFGAEDASAVRLGLRGGGVDLVAKMLRDARAG